MLVRRTTEALLAFVIGTDEHYQKVIALTFAYQLYLVYVYSVYSLCSASSGRPADAGTAQLAAVPQYPGTGGVLRGRVPEVPGLHRGGEAGAQRDSRSVETRLGAGRHRCRAYRHTRGTRPEL